MRKVEHVHGMVSLDLIPAEEAVEMSDSPQGKSYIRLTFPGVNGEAVTVAISTNLGENIGAAATGLRLRREDLARAEAEAKGRPQ